MKIRVSNSEVKPMKMSNDLLDVGMEEIIVFLRIIFQTYMEIITDTKLCKGVEFKTKRIV